MQTNEPSTQTPVQPPRSPLTPSFFSLHWRPLIFLPLTIVLVMICSTSPVIRSFFYMAPLNRNAFSYSIAQNLVISQPTIYTVGEIIHTFDASHGSHGRIYDLTSENLQPLRQWSPVISNNVMYLATLPAHPQPSGLPYASDAQLSALSLSTGKILWQFPIGNPGDNITLSETSPISDGIIYVVVHQKNGSASLYALHANDGSLLWHSNLSGYNGALVLSFTTSKIPLLAQNTIFLTDSGSRIYALNSLDGSLRWQHIFAIATPGSTPVPILIHNELYFAFDDTLAALNITNGSQTWQQKFPAAISSAITAGGTILYMSTDDGNIYALNTITHKILWQQQPGHPVNNIPPALLLNANILYITTMKSSSIFASNDDEYIMALRTTDGSSIWQYKMDQLTVISLQADDHALYLSLDSNSCLALRLSDGHVLWNSTYR